MNKYCKLIGVILVSSILNSDVIKTTEADGTLPNPVIFQKSESYKSLSMDLENISENFGKNVRAYAKSFVESVWQESANRKTRNLVNDDILNIRGLIYGSVKCLTESIEEAQDDYIKRILKRAKNQSQQLLDQVSALQNELFKLKPSGERKFKDKQVKLITNYMVELLLHNISHSRPDLLNRINSMTNQASDIFDNNLKSCGEKVKSGVDELRTKVNAAMKSLQPKIIELINQTEECLKNSYTVQQLYICWKRYKNQLFRFQNAHSQILHSDRRNTFLSKSRAEQRQCQRRALTNFQAEIERIKTIT